MRRRGGYCFEQNGLLFEVLQELGYDVHVQLARVIYNRDYLPATDASRHPCRPGRADVRRRRRLRPAGPTRPRPHAACRLTIEVASTRPTSGPTASTNRDPASSTCSRGPRAPRSRCTDSTSSRYGPYDCEIGHFYSHRHPEATFVNNLVVSRILTDEIRSLRNREYWVIRPDGAGGYVPVRRDAPARGSTRRTGHRGGRGGEPSTVRRGALDLRCVRAWRARRRARTPRRACQPSARPSRRRRICGRRPRPPSPRRRRRRRTPRRGRPRAGWPAHARR